MKKVNNNINNKNNYDWLVYFFTFYFRFARQLTIKFEKIEQSWE